jgi:pyruvate,water dikinase
VQRIAWARLSGVLQTVNVAEAHWREIVLNVGLGMGEGIVSGTVGADHVVVSKEADAEAAGLRFRYLTGDKRQRIVYDARTGGGTLREDTLSHQRFRPALEYVELLELVQVATSLEAFYGYGLDIEFAFEGPALRILQARPTPGGLMPWRETIERYPLFPEPRALGPQPVPVRSES